MEKVKDSPEVNNEGRNLGFWVLVLSREKCCGNPWYMYFKCVGSTFLFLKNFRGMVAACEPAGYPFLERLD